MVKFLCFIYYLQVEIEQISIYLLFKSFFSSFHIFVHDSFSTLHQSQIISPLVLKRIILLKQTTHKYLSSLILQHIRNIIIILHLSTTLLHTSTIHSINLSIIVVSVEFFLGENLVSLGCGNDAVGIFNEIALFVSFCGGVWFYEMN